MAVSVPVILASSSIYRQRQLQSLGLDFTAITPEVDESAQANESPEAMAARLAYAKAQTVKNMRPTACVIGSDQVCAFGGQIFGKPGTSARAVEQLQAFSNNSVMFFTALCVLTPTGQSYTHVDTTVVKFRALSQTEIQRYIEQEMPLNCAGSFKVESLGLSLFTSVESSDPSALLGLPLIKLCEFLRLSGFQIP